MQQYSAPPAKVTARMFTTRIGKICSNVSIFFLVLALSGIISFVSTAIILVAGFAIIVCSLGTIFITVPDFGQKLMSSAEISIQITSFFLQYWYIFISFPIVFSIISLTLLATDKTEKHTARIVLASVVLGISVLILILLAAQIIAR